MTEWKKQAGQVLFFTFLFGLCAHGFRYLRLDFTHDATLVYQNDDIWQIQLGRFLQPAYLALRGRLVAPLLIGLLSLLFLSAAAWLVIRLLGMTSLPATAAVCALMAVNVTLTFANATYLPWADIYMLSLLLSVSAVAFCLWKSWGVVPAAIAVCLSCGLYASYFQAAVFLVLLVLIRRLLAAGDWREILRLGLRALGALLLGLVLYDLVFSCVLSAMDLEIATSYNSVAGAGDFTGVDLPALLGDAWCYFFRDLFAPKTFQSGLAGSVNTLLLVLSLVGLILLGVRQRLSKYAWAALAVLVLLVPFGINSVYIISKGFSHGLMTYSFGMFPLLTLWVWQELASSWVRGSRFGAALAGGWTLVRGLTAVLVLCAVIFSNQVYLKKALEYDNTRAVLSRVLDRVEQVPGYVPGKTPVVLVGYLDDGPLSLSRPGFEDISGVGLDSSFSLQYFTTYKRYFESVLGYPIRLVSWEEAKSYLPENEVWDLKPFPDPDCVAVIRGVVTLRLSY